jgi:hypothetical protein
LKDEEKKSWRKQLKTRSTDKDQVTNEKKEQRERTFQFDEETLSKRTKERE